MTIPYCIFQDASHLKAIVVKAESLYSTCQVWYLAFYLLSIIKISSYFVLKFEHALALFLRGTRLVPDSTTMVMGITKCKKAILSKVTANACFLLCSFVPSGVRKRCLLLSWIQELH